MGRTSPILAFIVAVASIYNQNCLAQAETEPPAAFSPPKPLDLSTLDADTQQRWNKLAHLELDVSPAYHLVPTAKTTEGAAQAMQDFAVVDDAKRTIGTAAIRRMGSQRQAEAFENLDKEILIDNAGAGQTLLNSQHGQLSPECVTTNGVSPSTRSVICHAAQDGEFFRFETQLPAGAALEDTLKAAVTAGTDAYQMLEMLTSPSPALTFAVRNQQLPADHIGDPPADHEDTSHAAAPMADLEPATRQAFDRLRVFTLTSQTHDGSIVVDGPILSQNPGMAEVTRAVTGPGILAGSAVTLRTYPNPQAAEAFANDAGGGGDPAWRLQGFQVTTEGEWSSADRDGRPVHCLLPNDNDDGAGAARCFLASGPNVTIVTLALRDNTPSSGLSHATQIMDVTQELAAAFDATMNDLRNHPAETASP
jgi:hypothetical protein